VYAEPLSKQIEEQELEFLQFSFRCFNCLLIREVCLATLDFVLHIHIKPKLLSCHLTLQVPFHLATRLWDTYLAEGDYLPDFLLYIAASFLLTVSYGTLTHNWFLQILFESVSTSTVLRLRNVPKKILLVKYIFYLVTLNLKEVHMF